MSFDGGLQRAKSFNNIDLANAKSSRPLKTGNAPLKSSGSFRHKYDHVQSKVRKYIDSNSRGASVGRNDAKRSKHVDDDDIFGKSFQLSPGTTSWLFFF